MHPEAAAYLAETARLGLPPLSELGPRAAREARARRTPALAGQPEPIRRVEDLSIPGPGGALGLRLYADSSSASLPILVYFHGGGWVTGDLDTHDSACRGLARVAKCMVVAVDFRCAPENPFPAPLEDCWTATRWLAEHADELGGQGGRLAVGGDSAGGNLAAVVARRARDAGGPSLAAQVLIYPVTDCSLETDSYRSNATGYGLTAESMRWYWEQYLGPHGDGGSPDVSPLRTADLRGLPPALVVTCGLDPLLSEGVAYVQSLREAGVTVEHIHEADMIHGYLPMPAVISRARKTWDDCGTFLATHLHPAAG